MYREGESFCQTFELSSRVPEAVVNEAIASKQLHMVDVERCTSAVEILGEITKYLTSDGSAPVRICIPSLGSPAWGSLTNQVNKEAAETGTWLMMQVEYCQISALIKGETAGTRSWVCFYELTSGDISQELGWTGLAREGWVGE